MDTADVLTALRQPHDELNAQHAQHIDAVRELQRTLLDDVLPGILDELGLDSAEIEAHARDWLCDTESIFRLLRRHKFTRTFALQAARDVLAWRLNTLRPSAPHLPNKTPPSALTLSSFPSFSTKAPLPREPDHICLLPTRDPLGRPLVLFPASALSRPDLPSSEAIKHAAVLSIADALRVHLNQLNNSRPFSNDAPVIQYTIILDAHGLSLRTLDVELLRWFAAEVQPRFPGLVGAVLVTNYSWTQSGVWSVARRVLPKAAIGRVFFLAPNELVQLLGAQALPQQYGGTLMSSPPTPPPTPPLMPKRTAGTIARRAAQGAVTPSWTPPPPQTWKNLLHVLARLWWNRWGGSMRWLGLVLLLILSGHKLVAKRLRRRR